MITTKELRQKYLDFFKTKNHAIIAGASLLPENDPTVLFTTAGMHPLVPYLLGVIHPQGSRLANCQKCIRTSDIEEVGDNTHLTFFEMLGNWSLGDYFKKQAIEYSWEFLTSPDYLGLSKDKLAVSCFGGDKREPDLPKDNESAQIWQDLGLSPDRIAFIAGGVYESDNNWWGPAGQTGPCGPDTEMFYWTDNEAAPKVFDPDDQRWVEIWNDVFMQYNKTSAGKYESLQQKNVDTGMGLERTVAVLNGFDNVYEISSLKPIYEKVKTLAKFKNIRALRIITDHIRAAVMIMGDYQGVGPSNLGQGYIVRRLLRSAIRRGREIGIEHSFVAQVATVVIETLKDPYNELVDNKQKIISEITIEEEKFNKVLQEGEKKIKDFIVDGKISGTEAFILYSTFGFPIEEIKRLGVEVDLESFNQELAKHQDVSRQGSEQKFAGGLADHSEQTTKLHTATHLLHAALRQVLGDHVAQKGSNITKERLRFDFSHPDKMTPEQIKQVEDIVNKNIQAGYPVSFQEMTVQEAKQKGALGLFTHKYSDKVKVYSVGNPESPISCEICGGPHVANTSELGKFEITKEQASSAGVRRIKAILV